MNFEKKVQFTLYVKEYLFNLCYSHVAIAFEILDIHFL